jgi:hypothetical protein
MFLTMKNRTHIEAGCPTFGTFFVPKVGYLQLQFL